MDLLDLAQVEHLGVYLVAVVHLEQVCSLAAQMPLEMQTSRFLEHQQIPQVCHSGAVRHKTL